METEAYKTQQKHIYMRKIFTRNPPETGRDLLYNQSYMKDLHITIDQKKKRINLISLIIVDVKIKQYYQI